MGQAYDIFLNYRRQGGKDFARLLAAELQNRGYHVFLDFDELTDGKFDSRIMLAIEQAPVFITILSKGALNRGSEPEDWVRREIEYAIAQSRHIVPINPDFQFEGFPENIPDQIKKGIGQHQFSDIVTTSLFKESVNKLVADRIATIIRNGNKSIHSGLHSLKVVANTDCRLLIDCEEIATIGANTLTKVPLAPGEYRVQATPTDKLIASFEKDVTMGDSDRLLRIDFDLTPVEEAKEEAKRKKAEETEAKRKKE